MLDHPFLASAIARLPLVDATNSGWCSTAATDGYYIFVNQEFFEPRSPDDLLFVLAHEVVHCLLGHMDRRGSRNRGTWNEAVDYATNALLVEVGFKLPADALYERKFVGLSAEVIYRALFEQSTHRAGNRSGLAGSSLASSVPLASKHRFDQHLEPDDSEGADHRQHGFPSRLERERLRRQLVTELRNHLSGRTAGYFTSELEAATTRDIGWHEYLARFVTGLRRSDYRLFPPNRKHLWRGLYLSTLGTPGPAHLVIAIDTSGSMSDDLLRRVLSELDGLRSASECRLTVLQCDAKIQHVEVFEPFELSVEEASRRKRTLYGRGGTSLVPPFNWIRRQQEHGGHFDALIYCTDGYGEFPQNAPMHPVLWITPEHGTEKFPFGEVIRLLPGSQ